MTDRDFNNQSTVNIGW